MFLKLRHSALCVFPLFAVFAVRIYGSIELRLQRLLRSLASSRLQVERSLSSRAVSQLVDAIGRRNWSM